MGCSGEMRTATVAIGLFFALRATSFAQPLEQLTFSVVWDKAVIAHGETNTGKVMATIGPGIGTITAWNTLPGKGQTGIIEAFASAIFHFKGMENGLNGTFSWTIPVEFNFSSLPGVPWPTGGAMGVNAGQFGPPTYPNPNVKQTVTILEFAWHEVAGGGPYNVLFEAEATSAKVYLDVGLNSWVGENAVKLNGEGGFSVIPAASTAWPVVAGLAVLARRRRGG
jgi:hypothetical protein